MTIRNNDELKGIVRVGKVVRTALDTMKEAIEPGVTTQALDDLCADVFERHGARSGPQIIYDFPAVACISINDEAVHGIPKETRTIREGDLVKLDVTAELNGFFADAAITVGVGMVSSRRRRLARCARSALYDTLKGTRANRPINGIGRSIQTAVERQGFSVMPELGGHGVGRSVHEEPFVPNYYDPWDKRQLHQGLVIAIEPVISGGSGEAVTDDDGWTIKTADSSPSAHFEHTVIITQRGPLIVTA
jgi:methionyl aminopeptidase